LRDWNGKEGFSLSLIHGAMAKALCEGAMEQAAYLAGK